MDQDRELKLLRDIEALSLERLRLRETLQSIADHPDVPLLIRTVAKNELEK